LSTHILPEVAVTCSRIVIISNGRVVAEDTPENLEAASEGLGKHRADYRGQRAIRSPRALKNVPHVLNVEA